MNRVGFIGGSDCVKILRGEWLELWQVKTGRAQSEDLSDNLAVQMGILTEDFNISWFEKQHNVIVKDQQREFSLDIGGVPARGTVDGMTAGNILECKHTGSHRNMDEVIRLYMPQVQLYARLANADGAWLSVFFGNSKWESAYIQYDDTYFHSMWAVVSDFWNHVKDDREPIGIDDMPEIGMNHIPVNDMIVRDASRDNAFNSAAADFINLYEKNRTFENAKKDLKAMVADNEREVYCDYVSVKRDKRGSLRITRRLPESEKV